MNEPRRLLDDGGDDLARQLLGAGRDARSGGPSPELQAQMWSGIEAALGPLAAAGAGGAAAKGSGAAAAGSSAGGAASGGTSLVGASAPAAAPAAVATSSSGLGLAIGTKIGLAGLLLGTTFVTATVLRSPDPGPPPAPPSVVATGVQEAPRAGAERAGADRASSPGIDDRAVIDSPAEATPPADRADAPGRSRDAQPPSAATPPKLAPGPAHADSSKSATASNLVEEVAAVQKARTLLAQGSASQALAVLAELDKTIPRGSLGQERAVLSIEAFAASGQRGRAGQLASAFLAANPSSPYAERVRTYAE